jgi:hypothetical protein
MRDVDMCRLAVTVAEVASRCVNVCLCPRVLAHRVHMDACPLNAAGVSSGHPTSRSRVIVAVSVVLYAAILVGDIHNFPTSHQSISIALLRVCLVVVVLRCCSR